MFWDKKDQRLPDLPPLHLPESDFSDKIDYEDDSFPEPSHTLPSDAFEEHDESEHKIKEGVDFDEFSEKEPSKKSYLSEPSPNFIPSSTPLSSSAPLSIESKSSIFIKLDKFQSAKKSLVILEQKINEMENLLKKIRETRLREEQELVAWEKEVSMVKPRIEEISKNLFDKSI